MDRKTDLRERPFDFYGGGGGQEDFLKKIIRTVIRTNKIDRMTKQTKKKYPGQCEKKTGKKMSKDKWAQTDI